VRAVTRRTGKLQEVKFQSACDDRNIVLLKHFIRESLASVDCGAQVVRLRQWNIHKPDTATGFISLEVRIMVVKEGQDGGDDDRNTLLV
jgi:hypothetical protein